MSSVGIRRMMAFKGVMGVIQDILEHNRKFVEDRSYEKYVTSKYPDKHLAILSCMDARLTELLPDALGIKNGDVKMIKNAGAVVSHPFGSIMRSLLIAVYELQVDEIMVIGHYDCGVQHMDGEMMLGHMRQRGISQDHIDIINQCGVDLEKWFTGFDDVEQSVVETVHAILNHPLIPKGISVQGFLMDPVTGRLDRVK